MLLYSGGEGLANILVLNGSARAGGFTGSLISAFCKGAEEGGSSVRVINLSSLKIHSCIGCLKGGKDALHPCTIKDDMDIIYSEMKTAEVIVFATPLFFWSYSGVLKNVIDRLWALAECDRKMLIGNGRAGALLVSAGGSHPGLLYEHFDYMMSRLAWKNLKYAEILHTDEQDINNIPFCESAYRLGKDIG